MAASRVVNHATALGRSSRLGLAEAGRSEPLSPCLATLPRAVILGATAAMMHYRHARTADTPPIVALLLPSYRHRVRTGLLHLYAVAGPLRIAYVVRTWVGHHRHVI